jgi:hypothetical protein
MKVVITVIRRTEYASIVEMTDEKFKMLSDNLKNISFEERDKAADEVNMLIKPDDWLSDSLCQVAEFKKYD